jgi:ribosomal protein L16 Arg81 hydroxylase
MTLEQFLNPASVKDFFKKYWLNDFILIKHNLSVPFSLEEFDSILSFGNLTYPEIQCFDDKGEISTNIYCSKESKFQVLDINRLYDLMEENITVRISNISKHHKGISEWSKSLEKIFACQVHINAYYNKSAFDGLAPHYDPHHIFAIQLDGTKLWELGEVIINNPSHQFMPQPKEEISIKEKIGLKEGEMLYLPPGLWHKASTPSGSLHITVGIHPPRWSDYFSELIKVISEEHPIYRAYLPLEVAQQNCKYLIDNEDAAQLVTFLKDQLPKVNTIIQERINKSGSSKKKPADKNSQLVELYDDIWKSLNKPTALYLRGSFANPSKKHNPWDIDIYAIVEDVTETNIEQRCLCEKMENKYPNLPTIDISIMSLKNLQNSDKFLLKRLLLHYDGQLLKGREIKSIVKKPILNQKNSNQIRSIMGDFINKYFISQNWESVLLISMRTNEFTGYTRSLAKALIRSGTFIIIKNEKTFTRDLDQCYKALINEFPEISDHLQVMKLVIENRVCGLKEFFTSAQIIYTTIYKKKYLNV